MSSLSRPTAEPVSGPPAYRARRLRPFPAGCAPLAHVQTTGAPREICPGYAYIPPGVRAQRPAARVFLAAGDAPAVDAHAAGRRPPRTARSADSTVRLRDRLRARKHN